MKPLMITLSVLLFSITGCFHQTPISKMPYVENKSLPHLTSLKSIDEKRDSASLFYLQSSVRIVVPEGKMDSIGSGTICYYNEVTKYAYIISCAHLFVGSKLPNQNGTSECFIDVYYKGTNKLNKPERFKGEVICYDKKEDISFIRFKPDWKPNYFPIANQDFGLKRNDVFESTGCDEASPPAAYTVRIYGMEGRDLITIDNMARGGRSGGGLLTKTGYYIGIVWGAGEGYTYYVPLNRIHQYASQFKETKFLLEVGNIREIVGKIKIIHRAGSQKDNNLTIPFP